MTREIRFRGKRLDNREWVYGHLFVWSNGRCDIENEDSRGFQTVYSVDSATVGQYTGLKDKNGREVYEGDILKRTVCMRDYAECDGEVVNYYDVSYVDGEWVPFCDCGFRMYEYEVIGNTHDNPELLNQ